MPTSLAILALLAGCTTAGPQPTPEPTTTSSASGSTGPAASRLPSCDAITEAVGALVDGLAFDQATSDTNTAQEAYDQRVCVFVSPDGNTQLGFTIAAIPFQQTELDAYRTLPNSIQDARLDQYGGVIQTFPADDPDDGHLAKSLSLFDTTYSISVVAEDASGSTETSLPQLTVPAAIDAAFAIRALLD